MVELRRSTVAYLAGEDFTPRVLPHPYAFTLFRHNAEVEAESCYNGEALKVVAETQRILDVPELPMGLTCIRVPVLRAHAMAITVFCGDRVKIGDVQAGADHEPSLVLSCLAHWQFARRV